MRKFVLVGAALGLCLLIASLSGALRPTAPLVVEVGKVNPWTHLRINNDPDEFRFAVVADRTGGHRPLIFSRAVEQLNLLQPEFVISVGDLIEGYSKERELLERQWREFQGFVRRLHMPFFYTPGNHDISNELQDRVWVEKYGRRWYHFVYRNVLFLILNSEDPPGQEHGNFSKQQVEYVKQVLRDNDQVRWTFVAFHKPAWRAPDLEKNGWLEIEKALADRPYTVFVGHLHRYQKCVRQGRVYYQLATTGGVSKVRGPEYGECDHIAWVTMKKEGPIVANVLLEGVLTDDLRLPQTDEPGTKTKRLATYPVRGKVTVDGQPAAGIWVRLHPTTGKDNRRFGTPDGLTAADGSFVLSTYVPNDGAPEGEYIVTFFWPDMPAQYDGRTPVRNRLPARYGDVKTSDYRVVVNREPMKLEFDLTTK